jgi:hypothetical protein
MLGELMNIPTDTLIDMVCYAQKDDFKICSSQTSATRLPRPMDVSDCALALSAELTARMWSLPPLRHALPIWLEALFLANERRSCK